MPEKKDKRTFADIGRELGITGNRVRQVYVRMDWKLNRFNADHHGGIKPEIKPLETVDELSYRFDMHVDQSDEKPVCPRCGKTLIRDQQRFCGNCGQKLSWESTN